MLTATQNELNPIVDRVLLSLHKSTVGDRNIWDTLPAIDLWGLKSAPKVKPQQRDDGAIIKLIKYIIRNGTVANNSNILRLIELFNAIVAEAQRGRIVKEDNGDLIVRLWKNTQK